LAPFRPDLFVVTEERPPGDHVQGKGAQVQVVVQELLEQARLSSSTNSFFFVGSSRQAGRQAGRIEPMLHTVRNVFILNSDVFRFPPSENRVAVVVRWYEFKHNCNHETRASPGLSGTQNKRPSSSQSNTTRDRFEKAV
jgi:hypothetical protein